KFSSSELFQTFCRKGRTTSSGQERVLPSCGKRIFSFSGRLVVFTSLWISNERPQKLHPESHFNGRLYLHRFAVQQIRLIFPLLHGFHGSLDENRMPAHLMKVFDGSTLAYGCGQNYVSLD